MSQPHTPLLTLHTALPRLVIGLLCIACLAMLGNGRSTAAAAPDAPGIVLVETRASGATLRVTLPPLTLAYQMQDGRAYHAVTLDGYGTIGAVGLPDLPQTVVRLAIPAGAQPTAQIVAATQRTIAGVTPLPAPERTLVAYDYTDAASLPEFATRYALDSRAAGALYPADAVSLGQPHWLRDFQIVDITIRPIQADLARNSLTVYDELTISVDFAPPDAPAAEASPRPESAQFDGLLRNAILNYDQAQTWRSVPNRTLQTSLSPCLTTANGRNNAYRLSVTQDAIYRLTPGDLPGLPASVNINTLRVCYEDAELPLYRSGSNAFDGSDYILFYGQAIKTHDTQTNAYWLTYGTGDGLTMTSLAAAPAGGTPVTSYIATAHLERDRLYNPSVPLSDPNDRFDHWFDGLFGKGSTLPDRLNQSFNASNITIGGSVTLSAEVWGGPGDSGNHPFALRLNGQQVGSSATFSGSGLTGSRLTITRTVAADALDPGNNTVEVLAEQPTGGATAQIMLLNWLRVSYERNLQAQNNRLAFTHPDVGNFRFNTGGFSGGEPLIFDVSDPLEPVTLTGSSNGDFQPPTTKGPTAYYLLRPANALTPAAIVKDTPSTLRSAANEADYIIITAPSLVTSLQPLVAHRRAQGLTVRVVQVQDIFDEFGYGRYDTAALREFLYYAYTQWRGPSGTAPAPTYVLLAGDASFDHQDRLGQNAGRNHVPVYLRSGVDAFLGEAAADNQYVALGNYPAYGDLPLMLLGRLPAADAAEMSAMVSKTIANDNGSPDATWRRNHFFVSDNALQDTRRPANAPPGQTCFVDPAAPNPTFFEMVDGFIATHVRPHNAVAQRLFYARCHESDPQPHYAYDKVIDMPLRFADQIEAGTSLVTYMGHAGITFWGDEGFISLDVVDFLNNAGKYPIMLPMACLEGQYHRFDLRWQDNSVPDGLSEALVKRPNGGAVASFAPTGLQVTTGHDYLLTGFYDALLDDGETVLGGAIFSAKNRLRSGPGLFQDLHDTFMLLGDPALTVQLPAGNNYQLFLPIARKSP